MPLLRRIPLKCSPYGTDCYELRFDRVIFCGAIVTQTYPWKAIFAKDLVRGVLNDYGRQDFWARIVVWLVEDGGQSGYCGFTDTAEGRVVQIKHEKFRHSDYFFNTNYRNSWIPFLRGEAQQDIALTTEPINWRFWIVCLALLLALILGLGYVGYRLLS
jgi:hypothetical protein